MPVITEITPQKNKERVNIYLDGKFVCGLQALTAKLNKLAAGLEITLERLNEIQQESEAGTAFERAAAYLTKFSKTEKEIREYLKNKGYLGSVIDSVTAKLKEYNFINDERFTQNFIRAHASGSGAKKLALALRFRGVDRDLIEAALKNLDEQDSCRLQAEKHMKNKELTKENLVKLSRFLAGRGFNWDSIQKACSVLGETAED